MISNPSYPDPGALSTATAAPCELAPGVQIPQTVQYSIGIDHQLRKGLTLSVTYTGARGYHLFRSRDINAPLRRSIRRVPNPAYSVVREIESDGRQSTSRCR